MLQIFLSLFLKQTNFNLELFSSDDAAQDLRTKFARLQSGATRKKLLEFLSRYEITHFHFRRCEPDAQGGLSEAQNRYWVPHLISTLTFLR